MVLQRHLANIMMKQLFRHCAGYRIDWGKLFFAGAVMTVAGVMLQMFTLPYPLGIWLPVISWDEPLNGEMGLSERVTESIVTNVLLSSPAESSLSVPVEPAENLTVTERRKSVSRRRRKDININAKPTSPPPPPSRRSVPYRLQKFIWSLKPNEALEYARKEIVHAPLVTDDPELYAPLFQNVSTFKRIYFRHFPREVFSAT